MNQQRTENLIKSCFMIFIMCGIVIAGAITNTYITEEHKVVLVYEENDNDPESPPYKWADTSVYKRGSNSYVYVAGNYHVSLYTTNVNLKDIIATANSNNLYDYFIGTFDHNSNYIDEAYMETNFYRDTLPLD